MANKTYDKEADKERTPISDNSASGNQSSGGQATYNSDNPYDKSLKNKEENPAGPQETLHNNPTSKSSSTGVKSGTDEDNTPPEQLNDAENSPDQSFSYNSDGATGRGQNKKKLGPGAKLKRKAVLMVVGAIGGIISILALAFLALIPLKIEHIVSILEKHFFASSQNAIQNENSTLLKGYLRDHLLPAFKSCRIDSTLVANRTCNIHLGDPAKNPVTNLYKGWREANLETKLAKNYGIEFKYTKGRDGKQQWFLKTPGTSSLGDPIGDSKSSLDAGLTREFNSRAKVRAAVSLAMEDVTGWKKVMFRYKVGRLLEEKYAIKRCIIFCGTKDALSDKVNNTKYAGKLFFVERVVTPRNASLGVIAGCIFGTTTSCDGKTSSTTCAQSTCDELTGKTETQVEADSAAEVGKVSATFGTETANGLLSLIDDMKKAGGPSKYVINTVLNKIFNQEASTNAIDEVPVVGELGMLNQVFTFLHKLKGTGTNLQKYSYIVNSQAAVTLFAMYQTYASEIHTGHVTAAEVGAMTKSLSSTGTGCVKALEGKCDNPNDFGGTAQAEGTPLYSRIIAGNKTTQIPGNYKCKNNKLVRKGSLVCPEENLGAKNQTLSGITTLLNDTGLGALSDIWSGSIGRIFNAFTSITSFASKAIASGVSTLLNIFAPGLVDKAKALTGTLFTFLISQVVPNPFSPNESGGRTFDMMAAGADASGSTYAQTGLGGKKLSNKLVAKIQTQQENENVQEFKSQPLFARLFSTESDYSLVSKVALDIPLNVSSSFQTNFASLLNPLNLISNNFSSLFSSNVSAAATPTDDPFGVPQNGYDSMNTGNQETYWNAHCSDNAAQAYQSDAEFNNPATNWNNNTTTDPNSGQQVNTTTNQCILIKGSVGSTGAKFDASNLTQDDQADIGGAGAGSSSTASTSPPATGTLPTGSSKELATEILPYLKNGKIKCLSSGCPDIVSTANGTSIRSGSCQVDKLQSGILGLLLGLAQMGHTFILSALCSDHSTVDGLTEHNGGRAADFNTIDSVFMGPNNTPWDNTKITAGEKLDQDAATLISDKTKLQFGQVGAGNGDPQCHPTFSFQSGYNTYPDTCHHQHIAVEP